MAKGIDLIRRTISTNYTGRVFSLPPTIIWIPSAMPCMGVFDYLIKPVHYQRLQRRHWSGSPVTAVRYTFSERANQTHVDALF